MCPQTIETRIERLAAGGDGVGRAPDGRVLFVPLTVPGDLVRVRITKAALGALQFLADRQSFVQSIVGPGHQAMTNAVDALVMEERVLGSAADRLYIAGDVARAALVQHGLGCAMQAARHALMARERESGRAELVVGQAAEQMRPLVTADPRFIGIARQFVHHGSRRS